MTDGQLVATVTGGLVVVTAILAVVTFVGVWRANRDAASLRSVLTEQTSALVDAARANQAIRAV